MNASVIKGTEKLFTLFVSTSVASEKVIVQSLPGYNSFFLR